MARHSAGILVYRVIPAGPEVLLGHMGGPLWARKDAGAWTIPKGEVQPGEEPAAAAVREFVEETGHEVPAGMWTPLGDIRQSGGKVVTAWAIEGDLDATRCTSNLFEMEWPPRSGRRRQFPEIDRLAWLDLAAAHAVIVAGQRVLLERLGTLVTG